MARSSIDRDSLEYVKIPVTTPPGITISSQVVEIAVVAQTGRPGALDWRTGSWEDNTARILIGPTALALTAGTYNVWVRITDSPEKPVLLAGAITVT